MLMTDMTEDQRRTVRELSALALPPGVELLEFSNAIALIRQADDSVKLIAMHGLDDIKLSPEGLMQRAHEYDRAASEMRRFARIARAALMGDEHD